jgi:hypothetical protein
MSFKKIAKIFSLAAAAAIPLLAAAPVLAASATVSLVSSGSVAKGSYVTVTIKENSGSEPVNAASATLSYPTDKLSYISITSSSAFNIAAASSGGGGSVRVDRGALTPATGSQTVASVTFKALADSGTASVGVTSASVISANSNSDINSGSSGTNIALKAPAPAPAAAPADTIPPVITAVTVQDVKSSSVTISWTTSEPASSEVNYGLGQSYGLSATNPNPGTVHKLVLNSPLIQPATKYHFMVRSVDSAGNAATSNDATFTTAGATLLITVQDQKHKVLAAAEVDIDGHKGTTDKQGKVTIKDIGIGKKYGVITYRNHKYPITIEVTSTDKPQSATFSIKVSPNYLLPVIFLVALLLVLAYLAGKDSGHGPARSTWVGLGVLKSKLPLPKRNKASVTVKDNPITIHPDDKL